MNRPITYMTSALMTMVSAVGLHEASLAGDACEVTKLFASDAAPSEHFGWRVAMDGNAVLTGLESDAEAGYQYGAAYVFRFNGTDWLEEAKLTASDPEPNDGFGRSVAISGAVGLVGARWDDDACPDDPDCNSGSAYVYRYVGSQWIEETKLTASDASRQDQFGLEVAINGDVAVVGTRFDDDACPSECPRTDCCFANGTPGCDDPQCEATVCAINPYCCDFGWDYHCALEASLLCEVCAACGPNCDSGSAYVFRFNGSEWTEEAKLTASDAAAGDWFGITISISGDVIAVAAQMDDDACPENPWCDSGSVYVFRFNGNRWIEEAKLTASDAAETDWFGRVSISGDMIIVGAPADDDNGFSSGSAYVFRFDGNRWIEEAKLTPSDAGWGDGFGGHIRVYQDLAIITATGGVGDAAYVFRYDGTQWVEERKLLRCSADTLDGFAQAVAVYGETAVVGAHGDDDAGYDAGAVYVYDLSLSPGDLDCDGGIGPADLAQLLSSWGACLGCPEICIPGLPSNACPEDLDGDCTVGPADLAILLGNWG